MTVTPPHATLIKLIILLYISGPLDPLSTLQESPTRFPATRTESKDPSDKEKDLKGKTWSEKMSHMKT